MDETEIMAATEGTDTSNTASQASSKTYTQEEFNDAMAKMKASVLKKALKPFEDLGDPEELRQLKANHDRRVQEEQVKRGEFDKIIKELAEKKDQEIRKRDEIIQEFKLDQPLLTAAGEFKSVNPAQVKQLLRTSVRLNAEGEVEVVDAKGTVRYSEAGTPLQVRDLVKEFLDSNPHFVQPTPATTNSSHSVNPANGKVDLSKLDMRNPEHREIYRQATGG